MHNSYIFTFREYYTYSRLSRNDSYVIATTTFADVGLFVSFSSGEIYTNTLVCFCCLSLLILKNRIPSFLKVIKLY